MNTCLERQAASHKASSFGDDPIGGAIPSRASAPFGARDITVGCEIELHAAVLGDRHHVDLPMTIEASTFYANLERRRQSRDVPRRAVDKLRRFLEDNGDRVWDNSWVRFPRRLLSAYALDVLEYDLLADKRNPSRGKRLDGECFITSGSGEPVLRVPISYVIKLALADFLGTQEPLSDEASSTGQRLLGHFLNDHCSPESHSFHVTALTPEGGNGRAAAREVSLRFLLTQLLVMYANEGFGLKASGQTALVYFSPNPALRQKQLNECVSDAFYRDLFSSPCLAGWDEGESKHDYMRMCHEVLSRSQLNAVAKIRDAGLIVGNLVVLPNLSNISLANNGVHISLGSRRLSQTLANNGDAEAIAEEKRVGDLVIKVVEHFLPLFVGTYTAAPYRIDFADFHAERVLSFLPHELDFTHLRMFWRRWKRKAAVKIFGQPVTPSGYESLDRVLGRLFRLRGDYIRDFRLIDYLITPLSTDSCPALDGTPNNTERLTRDLAQQGVFDRRMPLYMLYRLREYTSKGFSGFEGRHYSLFESLTRDVAHATNLQALITAYAYQLALNGDATHSAIPDDPTTESERRQVFFGAAVGIPTFFVNRQTGNQFLKRLLAEAKHTRPSRRYPGYVRVHNIEYQRALIRILRRDAADLVEAMHMGETLDDVTARIESPAKHAVAERVTQAVLARMGAKKPMDVSAAAFNREAEAYYRDVLRRRHIEEAVDLLIDDAIDRRGTERQMAQGTRETQHDSHDLVKVLRTWRVLLQEDRMSLADIRGLITHVLDVVHHDALAEQDALTA